MYKFFFNTFIVGVLILFSNNCLAQEDLIKSKVKTSNREYDFLTKTYPKDSTKVLDGYYIRLLYKDSIEDFNFTYSLFVNKETKNVKAVLIKIIKHKKNSDKIRYLCMPINNDELYDDFNYESSKLGISMLMFYECLNKLLLSKFIDDKFNTERLP